MLPIRFFAVVLFLGCCTTFTFAQSAPESNCVAPVGYDGGGTSLSSIKDLDSKELLVDLGKMAGYEVFFDPQVTSRRIPVDLILVRWRDAMDFIACESRTSWRVVAPHSIVVEPQKVPKHRTTREPRLVPATGA